jgi:hypothetical protein
MDSDSKVWMYRLADTCYGQLQMLMDIEHELRMTRRTHVMIRLANFESRAAIMTAIMLAGVPTLWEILPEDIGWRRYAWPVVLGIVAGVYLIRMIYEWIAQKGEREDLKLNMPANLKLRAEDEFAYMMAQISTSGTRLSMIRDILKISDLPPRTRTKFAKSEAYFRNVLEESRANAEQLHLVNAMGRDDYNKICEWVNSALDHVDQGPAVEQSKT